jgi:hypothetical protein
LRFTAGPDPEAERVWRTRWLPADLPAAAKERIVQREQKVAALTLAVVASVRHQDTDYDELLMSGVPREEARVRIRSAIDRVLVAWA